MSNSYFKFKQFTVYQDKCAMKVGTDGVLLGSWVDLSDTSNILDIGTGTGLIALMLAQRSIRPIPIDAIDIDKNAILQAESNVNVSPFCNIVECYHSSLQNYALNSNQKYDVIVSNPPYFSSSLHSPDKQRTLARHTDSLLINDLLSCSARLLSNAGRVSVVYPYFEKANLLKIAENLGLFVSRITNVFPTLTSNPKRMLVEFSVKKGILREDDLVIERERHKYTPEFEFMMKEFYLNL